MASLDPHIPFRPSPRVLDDTPHFVCARPYVHRALNYIGHCKITVACSIGPALSGSLPNASEIIRASA